MKKLPWFAILAWSMAAAAATDDNPAEALKRVAAKVLAREAALPNYTCVETVTRDYYQSATTPKSCASLMAPKQTSSGLPPLSPVLWTVTDRLRLDVTITRRGEIYSWVGASKFEDSTIDQIVKEGPFGTGSFGALLTILFHQDPKTFRFTKYALDKGRSLMEFSFEVNQEDSRYQIKAGNSWTHAAYSGTLQVDPATDEVVRVTLQTAELPEATGSCQDLTMMELRPTRIGGGEFPLPTGAWERFVARTGEEAENTVSLSNCREYKGESTISFADTPEPAGGSTQAAARRIELPPGLPFTIEMTAPISTDTAGAGDSFTARLVNPLRDKQGKTLAPAHALVEGRLVLVEMRHTFPPGAVIVLKPATIEIAGVKTPLAASLRSTPTPRGKAPIKLPLAWEQNSGIVPLAGSHAELKVGFRSNWQTAPGNPATVSK